MIDQLISKLWSNFFHFCEPIKINLFLGWQIVFKPSPSPSPWQSIGLNIHNDCLFNHCYIEFPNWQIVRQTKIQIHFQCSTPWNVHIDRPKFRSWHFILSAGLYSYVDNEQRFGFMINNSRIWWMLRTILFFTTSSKFETYYNVFFLNGSTNSHHHRTHKTNTVHWNNWLECANV